MATPIETIKPREEEAQAIEQAAGYIVARTFGDRPPQQYGGERDYDAACRVAASFAASYRGQCFGVFKLVRDFACDPSQGEQT